MVEDNGSDMFFFCSETFCYGFIVPILPYMVEKRNHIDPSKTQQVTYLLLMCYGIVSTISSIFIGQLADRCQSRKGPLILSLIITLIGTVVLAVSQNCKFHSTPKQRPYQISFNCNC